MTDMAHFREIPLTEFAENVFTLIPQDWMLLTAGGLARFNTMTASWGGLGHLWAMHVSFVVVRPQRYTFELMESESHFSLTFLPDGYRDVLNYCGTHSGRDVDKVAVTGLTPFAGSSGVAMFAEGRLILECRKLYAQDLSAASFVDTSIIPKVYPTGDFHRLYVGEITRCLVRR